MLSESETKPKPWWQTLPAILSALATLIGAITALIVALNGSEPPTPINKPENQTGQKTIHKDEIPIPSYVVVDEAYSNEMQARNRLVVLGHNGYKNTSSYLWIPKYSSLSGKELFQTFIGPFNDAQRAESAVCDYNKKFKKITYAVLVSHERHREEIRCTNP